MTQMTDDRLAEIENGFIGHPEDDYYFVEAKDFAWLIKEVKQLREAGNDLMDALLTCAPSTMYPRIVRDAMSAWQDAIGLPGGTGSRTD